MAQDLASSLEAPQEPSFDDIETTVMNSPTGHYLIVPHGGKSEKYEIVKSPPPKSYLVTMAKGEILHDVSLGDVLEQLDRSADLMYLAYLGTIGTEIAFNVHERQNKLLDACQLCVHSMQILSDQSHDVVDNLRDVFKNLMHDDSKKAIAALQSCKRQATVMALTCGGLSERFKELKEDTRKDSGEAVKLVTTEQGKMANLDRMKGEMETTIAGQKKLNESLQASIADLKGQIAEAKADEDKAADRQFALGLTKAIMGGVSAGLGAALALRTGGGFGGGGGGGGKKKDDDDDQEEVKSVASSKNGGSSKGGKGGKGSKSGNSLKNKSPSWQKASNKKNEAEATKRKAYVKKIEKKRAAALAKMNHDKAATKLTEAQNAKPLDESKLKQAQAEEKASNTALGTAQDEEKTANTEHETAETASKAMNDGFNKIDSALSQMEEEAGAREESIRKGRIGLMSLKIQQEEENRNALQQIAELTKGLEFNAEQHKVCAATLDALQAAVWAFDNISTALEQAQAFWSGMQDYCDHLAKPEVMKNLIDESEDPNNSSEDRIKYYTDNEFMRSAVYYLVHWRALAAVCDDYMHAATKAKAKVNDNINRSPTIEEARAQLQPLKNRLLGEIEKQKKASEKRQTRLEIEQTNLMLPAA